MGWRSHRYRRRVRRSLVWYTELESNIIRQRARSRGGVTRGRVGRVSVSAPTWSAPRRRPPHRVGARLDATMIEHISRDNPIVTMSDEDVNGQMRHRHGHRARSGREQIGRAAEQRKYGRFYRFSGFRKIVVYRLKIGRPTGRGAVTSELRRGDLRSSKFEDGNTNYKTSPCSGLSIFPGRRKRTEKVLWTTQFVSQILQIRHTPLIVDLLHAYLNVQRHRRMKRT